MPGLRYRGAVPLDTISNDLPTASWPLSVEQRGLIVFLGELIRRAGAARFLSTRLVRADERDFPDPWEATSTAVHRLLYRLFWHAYLENEIELDDHRPRTSGRTQLLETSAVDFVAAGNERVTFQLEAIGNDDIAGLLSHQVGAAFLALVPPDPFRETKREATPAEASAAAVYLGLGVLVANSAMYVRSASRLVGDQVFSERHVATAGGLTLEQATLLVAVQDVVRDDVQDALTTLHASQLEWVERWREVLDTREAELRALLELDDREQTPLVRAAAPRVPAAAAEPDLRLFNHGRITFRVPRRLPGRFFLGTIAGLVGLVLLVNLLGATIGMIGGIATICGGALIGIARARRVFECADIECSMHMTTELPACPGCGGTIADTIAHAGLRLERLSELEGEAADLSPDESA